MTGQAQIHLTNGLQAHQQGDLSTAGAHYQKVLEISPGHPDALHLYGVLMLQSGAAEIAVQLIEQAIKSNPDQATYHSNHGMALKELGRLEDAASSFHRSIDLDPGQANAMTNLGGVLVALERYDDALHHLNKALELDPNQGLAKMNIGIALKMLGNIPEAERAAKEACELIPGSFEAHFNLAMVLKTRSQNVAASNALRKSALLNPSHFEVLQILGEVELSKPKSMFAKLAFEIAAHIDPTSFRPTLGLADMLRFSGDLNGALSGYKAALQLDPDDAHLRLRLAMAQMAAGDFENAWSNYEYRLQRPGAPKRIGAPPRWEGQSLEGKTLVIGSEQGIGDEILYSSFIGYAIEDAAHCIIECSDRLKDLFVRSFPTATIQVHQREGGFQAPQQTYDWLPTDPRPDYFIEVGSLPQHYWTRRQSRDGIDKFLIPDPTRVDQFKSQFAEFGSKLTVGFTWRSLFVTEDRLVFYTALSDWRPVFRVPGVTFVCLQYGEGWQADIEQAKSRLNADIRTLDTLDTTNDLDGVLAAISACDLIITPNGTVGWMGPAAGVETWLLYNSPGLFDQIDNPAFGYNMLKDFSKKRGEQWAGPMNNAADALRSLVESG